MQRSHRLCLHVSAGMPWRRDPRERPTAVKLLQHAWLAETLPRGLAAPLTNIATAPELLPRVRATHPVLLQHH